MSPKSALAGVFREYTLEFEGTATPVLVYLKPVRTWGSPNLREAAEMLGSDLVGTPMTGRMIDPILVPDNVYIGSQADMAYAGRTGTFIMGPIQIGDVVGVDEVLGQPILGEWRSH